ncbi:MAG: bifunctional riboflavin kinase/FAD synthetase [Lachnospiraceae bacterium]|nr:bifunctional riboflavin kinase/FAD synthetase [Lachnospiraceae bacterium]
MMINIAYSNWKRCFMMEYVNSKDFKFENTIVTFGKFDGFHAGHQKILEMMKSYKKEGMKTVIFSFSKQPKEVLNGKEEYTILSNEEKHLLHEKTGVDVLIEYPFDKKFAQMNAKNFVEKVIFGQLKAKYIICGEDFHFGKNRSGDVNFLKEMGKEYGFEVVALEKEKYENIAISSSRIRESLAKGDFETVNNLLGYTYFMAGKVIHGKQLGRKLGFPTMNLEPDKGKLIPPDGVYITKGWLGDKCYESITNIGTKGKILNDGRVYSEEEAKQKVVETFLLDANKDVYGETVKIEFYHFLRPEKAFSSADELIAEVNKNIEETRVFFQKNLNIN